MVLRNKACKQNIINEINDEIKSLLCNDLSRLPTKYNMPEFSYLVLFAKYYELQTQLIVLEKHPTRVRNKFKIPTIIESMENILLKLEKSHSDISSLEIDLKYTLATLYFSQKDDKKACVLFSAVDLLLKKNLVGFSYTKIINSKISLAIIFRTDSRFDIAYKYINEA